MQRRAGFTLIELVCCLAFFIGGLVLSRIGAHHYGWPGAIIGFILGFVGVVGLLALFFYLMEAGGRIPRCHTGRCTGNRRVSWSSEDFGDYRDVGLDGDHHIILRCRCGRDYVLTDGGSRFMERLPDGTLKPYLTHRPFRGWFSDERGE